MMKLLRTLLMRRLALILGGVIAVSCAAEIGLRMVLGLGHPVLYTIDPRFGSFPTGDQHLRRFFVHVDINHLGMRSEAVSDLKANAEYRILFVGDSVCFGTTLVDQKDTFVARIAKFFESHRTKVSVLNASSPGWAPSNEFGFIEAKGIYSADMVVLVYNTKDLTQPFSPYIPSILVPQVNPRTAVGELWSRYILPRVFPTRAVVDPGSVAGGPANFANEPAVLDSIERTRQFVTSHGAEFVILFSPAKTSDIESNSSAWGTAFDTLKSWTAAHQVPFLDLTEALSTRPSGDIYFDGIHLKPEGNAIAANVFTRWFTSRSQALRLDSRDR